MAIPFKSNIDLTNNEAQRMRLHNLGANPTEVGRGLLYFNTSEGLNTSKHAVLYDGTDFKALAYVAEVDAVSAALSALNAKVSAFLDGDVDSDAVLENLKEIQAFLDSYDSEVSLSDMLNEINGRIDEVEGRATKVSVVPKLTSGKKIGAITVDDETTELFAPAKYNWNEISHTVDTVANGTRTQNVAVWSDRIVLTDNADFKHIGYGYPDNGWRAAGPAISFGVSTYSHQIQATASGTNLWHRSVVNGTVGDWYKILDEHNYPTVLNGIYAPYNAAGYLPLSGGILTGGSDVLTIKRNTAGASWIKFADSTSGLGYLGFSSAGVPAKMDADGSNVKELLHEGNVSDYAALKDGSNASGTWGINISGNAATATALKTAVNLWGNSFDGTQSLDGSIVIGKSNALRIKDASDDRTILALGSRLEFGYGAYLGGYGVYYYGKSHSFLVGASSPTTAMTISPNGRVLINNPQREDRQFAVGDGGIYIRSVGVVSELGQIGSNTLLIGSANYGLQQWVEDTGVYNMQVGRFDGTATAYALNLNPLGGAVNVGDGGLNVKGKTTFNSAGNGIGTIGRSIYLHTNGTYATSDTVEFAPEYTSFRTRVSPAVSNSYSLGSSSYRWSNVYSVNGDFSGSIKGSVPSGGSNPRWLISSGANGLYIQASTYDGSSAEGVINLMGYNANVLTNFNVKATVSNFSNRVLIGGATDDGTNALQFKGGMRLQNGTYDYFTLSQVDVNVRYNAYDANDGWCNHVFKSNDTNRFFISGRDTVSSYIVGSFDVYDKLTVEGLATFNSGIIIPTDQTLKIGDATLSWDSANNALKVDKSIYSDGEVSAGAAGEEGESTSAGGGSGLEKKVFDIAAGGTETSFTFEHNLATRDISVTIYENVSGVPYGQIVLADVAHVNDNTIEVSFGSAPDVAHRVVVIG